MGIKNAIKDMRTVAKSNSYDKKLFITLYQKLVPIVIPKVEVYSSNNEIDKAFNLLCKELIKQQEEEFTRLDKAIESFSKEELENFFENFDEKKSLNELLKITEESE